SITYKRLKKRIQELIEKKRIKALFRHGHTVSLALLSEYVNLLITEVKPETADQKMRDFEAQIDLTEEKQQKLFSEKTVKRDFEMIITSDEEKKKKKNKK
ncbi:uncharacterized protein BDCG_17607, partial [Blastomyces dermatitidis ER-3]